MTLIDLHTHSRASDGTLTPAELVAQAAKSGLAAVALTDHDSLAGLAEAGQAGRELGVEVVPGVELSVADGARSVHILGLFLSDRPGPLAETLATLRAKRHDRNRLILDKLGRLGIHLDYDAVNGLGPGRGGPAPHRPGHAGHRGGLEPQGGLFALPRQPRSGLRAQGEAGTRPGLRPAARRGGA